MKERRRNEVNKRDGIRLPIMCIIVAAICCFAFCPERTKAMGAGKVVRVAVWERGSRAQLGEDGSYHGYDITLLEELQEFSGHTYQYVATENQSDAIEQLVLGNVDMLSSVAMKLDSEVELRYSSLSTGYTVGGLLTLAERDDIQYENIDIAKNYRIGYLSGVATSDSYYRVAGQFCTAENLIGYPSNALLHEALWEDKVDIIATGANNVTDDEKLIMKFEPVQLFFAGMKSNQELMDEVNEALTSLLLKNPERLVELQEEYLPMYYEEGISVQEQEAIRRLPVLRVGYFVNPPYAWIDKETKEPKGINIQILHELSNHVGFEYEFILCDSQNLRQSFLNEEIDLLLGVISADGWEEVAGANLTDSYLSSMTMFLNGLGKDRPRDGDAIGITSTSYLSRRIVNRNYPEYRIVEYETIQECINAVENGLVACMACNYYQINDVIAQSNKLQMIQAMNSSEKLSLVVSRRTGSELISLINKGLTMIPKNRIQEIISENSIYQTGDLSLFDYLERSPGTVLMVVVTFVFLLLLYLVLVFSNHTKQKQNRKLAEIAEQAKEANQAKSIFLSKMSHELRTPLNTIAITSALAEGSVEDKEKLSSYLDKIKASSSHLISLINDLLDMAKIENNRMELVNEEFSLKERVNELVTVYSTLAEQKGIVLRLEMPNVTVNHLLGDSRRVFQILVNLIGNAIKFTSEGSVSIIIEQRNLTENDDVTLRFSIIDTGQGIPEKSIDTVFESFNQGDCKYSSKVGGTGLGLSISQSFAQLMGSKIMVESEEGTGSKFYFDLTFRCIDCEYVEETSEDKDTFEHIAGSRILLAEDNEINCEIAKTVLETAGAVVETAGNGRIAFEMVRDSEQNHFDIILMDIRMPEMDGYEAAVAIRGLERSDVKELPMVAMTAEALIGTREKAFVAGMEWYVTKPIIVKELYRVLEQVLSRKSMKEW